MSEHYTTETRHEYRFGPYKDPVEVHFWRCRTCRALIRQPVTDDALTRHTARHEDAA